MSDEREASDEESRYMQELITAFHRAIADTKEKYPAMTPAHVMTVLTHSLVTGAKILDFSVEEAVGIVRRAYSHVDVEGKKKARANGGS